MVLQDVKGDLRGGAQCTGKTEDGVFLPVLQQREQESLALPAACSAARHREKAGNKKISSGHPWAEGRGLIG